MSYSARWLRKAVAETHEFWTLQRIAVAVSGPVAVAILWATIWNPWRGWWPVMQVAVISLLGFFAAWGISFFVCLLIVPAQLETQVEAEHAAELFSVMGDLEQSKQKAEQLATALAAKNPHDEHRECSLQEALNRVGSRDKEFLRLLLDNGKHNRAEVQGRGFGRELHELNSRLGIKLIDEAPVRNMLGNEVECYYQINE